MNIHEYFEEAKAELISPRKTFLTEFQKAAVETIQNYFWAKQEEADFAIKGRFHLLLIGPSGSGKSHVVRESAHVLNLPIFQINLSDWIVRGASTTPYTLDSLREFVRRTECGLVFFDEVDKLRSTAVQTQGWWQSLATEVFSVLDGKESLLSMDWNRDDVVHLNRCLIVGAGAWHEAIATGRKTMGFGTSHNDSFSSLAEKSKQIPYEVFARFGEVVEIRPPTIEDFMRGFDLILKEYGFKNCSEAKLREMAMQADEEDRGARGLEQLATKLALWKAKKSHPNGFPKFTETTGNKGRDLIKTWCNSTEVKQRFLKRCDVVAQYAIEVSSIVRRFECLNYREPHESELDQMLTEFAGWVIQLARPQSSDSFARHEHLVCKRVECLKERMKADIHKYLDQTLLEKASKFYAELMLWEGDYAFLLKTI